MKATLTFIDYRNFFFVRSFLILFASFTAIIVYGQPLYGPQAPPPKGAVITYTGLPNDGGIGRSGGKTFTFTNVLLANTTNVYWTILEDSVKLSLDGDTYETGEILSLFAGETNLANGIITWTGNTQIPISKATGTGIDHYEALYSKFVLTVTDQISNPLPLVSPEITGLNASTGGAVLIQANTFSFKAQMEMFVSPDGSTWTPHLDYYDAKNTPPAAESAYSVVDFGFYWENDPPELKLNTGANVDENDIVRITTLMLKATDVESHEDEISIVFDLVGNQDLPKNGELNFNGTKIIAGEGITMFDLEHDNLNYIHDGSETTKDSLAFSILDDDGAKCYIDGDSVFFFKINITPVDDPPTVLINSGSEVGEGLTVTISSNMLLGSDAESGVGDLVFTLDPGANSVYPERGLLKLNDVPLSDGGTFTQLDINNNLLTYDHDGTQTSTDGFVFNLADGYGHLAGNNGSNTFFFTISINNTNDDPVLTKLKTLEINEGATGIISNLYLAASDEESHASEIRFVYDPEMNFPGPDYGKVMLNGVEVQDGESFSMQDINNNFVTYVHDGGEGRSDFFIFRIIDGEGGVAHDGVYTDFHFNISISNENDPPEVINPIPDQIALINEEFSFSVPKSTFIDPDESDEISYSVTVPGEPGLPDWLSFDNTSGMFNGTPQETDAGTFSVVLTAKDLDQAEAMDTFNITVQVAIVTEQVEEPQCRIYPNPAKGIIYIYLENIDLPSTEIRVINGMGRLIYYQGNLESNQLILNLTDQPVGVYFVKINNAKTDLSFRVFIK